MVKLVMRAGALRVAFRDDEMLLAGGSDVLCIFAIDPPESPAIPLVPGDEVCSLLIPRPILSWKLSLSVRPGAVIYPSSLYRCYCW